MATLRIKFTEELLFEYKKKRDSVLKGITEKFDLFYDSSHNDLEGLIDLLNYIDRMIVMLNDSVMEQGLQQSSINRISEQLISIKAYHASHSVFGNSDKWDKWITNAIILVVKKGYEFNGIGFIKKGGTPEYYPVQGILSKKNN